MIHNNLQRNWLQRVGLVLVFTVGLLSILATGGGSDDDGDDTPQVVAAINGSVIGSGGIADVEVSAGGQSATTDLNGFYELTEVPVPGDGLLVLTYEKEGYATFQRTVPVAANKTYSVTASLLAYHYSEQMDATVVQDLTVADPANPGGAPLAELSFPAGTLGSGDVTVNVAVGDPTTDEGRPTFPGDYMAASTQGGDADTPLESVVFTEITIHDANGNEITEVTEPVTITLRLPDALQTAYSAGETIEWWSYDEVNGTWIREDADPATPGTLDDAAVIDQGGVLYAQAKVTHFTWWNVDQPMEQHACLCVTVVEDNLPLAGMQLIAEGVTYNGRSRPVSTGADGKGCVTVKRSSDSVTERIRLFVELGSVQFPYNVTAAVEGDVDSNQIFSPTTEGSTVYNTGQCVDLTNNLSLSYDGRITGRVTFEDSNNTPVVDYVINSDFGATATTDSSGDYEMEAPLGLPVTLFAIGQAAETVTVADANTPQVVNFEIANRAPIIDNVSRAPGGSVTNNQAVNLTVTAHDDDGDALSYSWSASQGSLNITSAASVIWTAPAVGAGTATLTVTVTDGKGGEASQNVTIVFSGAVSGDSLSFIFKDDLDNDQPVAGVVVALYNTDNVTIAQTLTSGVDGVVDFGDIGRSRASFTIVYESDGAYADRIIESFVEMQVANAIVYYTEGGDLYFDANLETGSLVANVNYTLSDVPANAGLTVVAPSTAWWNFSTGSGQLGSIPIYDTHLQGDGSLSLLASVNSATNTTPLIGYGFLLDQTVTEGVTYNIPLNRTPVTTGWTTQPTTDLDYISIIGLRDGISYILASVPYFSTPGASNTLQVPTEFPVDYYWVFAYAEGVSSGTDSFKRYNTLPQSLVVPMPDYSFSNVMLNETTGIVSWTLSGSTPRDAIDIFFEAYGQQEQFTEWSITMAPDVSSWQLMELPAPANGWIDTATLDDADRVEIGAVDMDFVSGIDEIWQFFISGGSFTQNASQILSGWANIPVVNPLTKLSAQSLVSKSSVEVKSSTDKRRARRSSGLSKLRRQ